MLCPSAPCSTGLTILSPGVQKSVHCLENAATHFCKSLLLNSAWFNFTPICLQNAESPSKFWHFSRKSLIYTTHKYVCYIHTVRALLKGGRHLETPCFMATQVGHSTLNTIIFRVGCLHHSKNDLKAKNKWFAVNKTQWNLLRAERTSDALLEIYKYNFTFEPVPSHPIPKDTVATPSTCSLLLHSLLRVSRDFSTILERDSPQQSVFDFCSNCSQMSQRTRKKGPQWAFKRQSNVNKKDMQTEGSPAHCSYCKHMKGYCICFHRQLALGVMQCSFVALWQFFFYTI